MVIITVLGLCSVHGEGEAAEPVETASAAQSYLDVLTDATFSEYIGKHDVSFVKFYAPWY